MCEAMRVILTNGRSKGQRVGRTKIVCHILSALKNGIWGKITTVEVAALLRLQMVIT